MYRLFIRRFPRFVSNTFYVSALQTQNTVLGSWLTLLSHFSGRGIVVSLLACWSEPYVLIGRSRTFVLIVVCFCHLVFTPRVWAWVGHPVHCSWLTLLAHTLAQGTVVTRGTVVLVEVHRSEMRYAIVALRCSTLYLTLYLQTRLNLRTTHFFNLWSQVERSPTIRVTKIQRRVRRRS